MSIPAPHHYIDAFMAAVPTTKQAAYRQHVAEMAPLFKQHGALHPEGMHAGDLPNIDSAGGGPINQEFFLEGVKLADVMDADGGSFIVHADADDYVSQPAGNAGDRIACGVFEATAATN